MIKYNELILEFLIALETQFSTRRFVNTLLDDHQIVILCRMAPFNQQKTKDIELLKSLVDTLALYAKLEVNDHTGAALSNIEALEAHRQQLVKLQVRSYFMLFAILFTNYILAYRLSPI